MKFKKDDLIIDIVKNKEDAEAILLGFGMHCLHCMMAHQETLEQACLVHGIDVNEVLKKLNNK